MLRAGGAGVCPNCKVTKGSSKARRRQELHAAALCLENMGYGTGAVWKGVGVGC